MPGTCDDKTRVAQVPSRTVAVVLLRWLRSQPSDRQARTRASGSVMPPERNGVCLKSGDLWDDYIPALQVRRTRSQIAVERSRPMVGPPLMIDESRLDKRHPKYKTPIGGSWGLVALLAEWIRGPCHPMMHSPEPEAGYMSVPSFQDRLRCRFLYSGDKGKGR